MADRANIFDDADFDLSGFTPAKPAAAPAPEAIRKVAEKAAFPSRDPEKQKEPPEKTGRERRIYRTGRNAQFFCKATPEVVEEFYAISNAQGWVMGETLERAVAALKRELQGRGGKP